MNKIVFVFLWFLALTVHAQENGVQPNESFEQTIVFEENPQQRYGFDGFEYEAWIGNYEKWSTDLIPNYPIAYKSVGEQQGDVVNARFKNVTQFDADSLTFIIAETEQQLLFSLGEDQLISLSLPPMSTSYLIGAFYAGKEVGRLKVIVYKPKFEKVIVVPLMKLQINQDSLKVQLNHIYSQANLQFSVEIQPPFVNKEWDATQLFDNPSPVHDRYTNQMITVRDLYLETHPNADRKAFYVFIIPGFMDEHVRGYMVRNKVVAFVKAAKSTELVHDVARQLGRGIGLLKDTWQDKGPERGSTDNLMDWSGGNRLTFQQWEDLRHSTHSFSFYDNYEDVRTNNGFVAYYFWKEDAKGNIVMINNDLLQSIKRPYKKNFRSYQLNIDNFMFQTLFKIKGRLICTWHIIEVVVIFCLTFFFGRKMGRYLKKRFKRPRFYRFSWRIMQLVGSIYLSYLGFLFVNLGYGWYEVHSGKLIELDQLSMSAAIKELGENVNYKYPSESTMNSELIIQRGNSWYKSKRKRVLYFSLRQDQKGNWNILRFHAESDSLLVPTEDFSIRAESHYMVINYVRADGSFQQQKVYNHLGNDITEKLKIPDPAKRILLFVNGYRPTSVGHTFEENFQNIQTNGLEFPDSKNLVYTFDRYDYWRPWQEMDLRFQKRINPVETFYADGHFSVSTSNHRSLINFTSTSSVYPKRCSNSKKHICYRTQSVNNFLNGSRTIKTVNLHRMRSNKSGFRKRFENGRIAGRNIYQMLNEVPNKSANDTLFIVAHSMGYAYALGIIEELRGHIEFGSLYIIAPENAKGGSVRLSEWKEVWQYGSNFNKTGRDAPCLLDGVAPQSQAGGLKATNRIYIPQRFYRQKGFFDSHFIGYFKWVFDIKKGKHGHITQR